MVAMAKGFSRTQAKISRCHDGKAFDYRLLSQDIDRCYMHAAIAQYTANEMIFSLPYIGRQRFGLPLRLLRALTGKANTEDSLAIFAHGKASAAAGAT